MVEYGVNGCWALADLRQRHLLSVKVQESRRVAPAWVRKLPTSSTRRRCGSPISAPRTAHRQGRRHSVARVQNRLAELNATLRAVRDKRRHLYDIKNRLGTPCSTTAPCSGFQAATWWWPRHGPMRVVQRRLTRPRRHRTHQGEEDIERGGQDRSLSKGRCAKAYPLDEHLSSSIRSSGEHYDAAVGAELPAVPETGHVSS